MESLECVSTNANLVAYGAVRRPSATPQGAATAFTQ